VCYSKNINNCNVGTTQLTDYKCIPRKLEMRKNGSLKNRSTSTWKFTRKWTQKDDVGRIPRPNSSLSTEKLSVILNYKVQNLPIASTLHSFCPTYFGLYDDLQKDYFECVLKHVEYKK
jgi:hypothetical protein